MCNTSCQRKWISFVLSFLLILSLAVSTVPQAVLASVGPELHLSRYEKIVADPSGRQLIQAVFPMPPQEATAATADVLEAHISGVINTLSSVPAFDWSYGCAATSAAMLFGYYDRSGYSNMYTGPTDGGACPLNNSVWGHTVWPGVTCGECPLSATHNGVDGRTVNGHVDDYWKGYGQGGPDPYVGQWTEHTLGDCVGDYMGTNQAECGNTDGSTIFYLDPSGDPLYDYTGSEPAYRDGCHGMKLFAESRGYAVLTSFTQLINGQGTDPGKGFTFVDFQAEINAGRPVLILLTGHAMLGYGYDASSNIIYVHDTWDYSDHQMAWGGTYSGMQQLAVTVLRLETATAPETPDLKWPTDGSTTSLLAPTLEWNASRGATSYEVQVSTDSSFTTSLAVDETGITDLFYDVPDGILDWNVIYYWRVRAVDSYVTASDWSATWSFRTAAGSPPAAPTGLTANAISSSRIDLAWQDNSSDEVGVKIERMTGSGPYSQIATVGADVANYSNSGLSAGTAYYYRVKAYSAIGDSSYSNEASAMTLPSPPLAPTPQSPASGSTVPSLIPRLEWNASTGAVSYGIQVSVSSSFTTQVVNKTGITSVFYDIPEATLNWNTTYYWRVTASNSYNGTSSWSSSRYFKTAIGPPPNAPSTLMATPVSSSQINLTWQDNSSDETGFKVERKTGSGSYSQIATVSADVTSYSSTMLSASTNYYYRVRAYKSTLNSDYCQEAAALTLPPPPAAPTLKSPSSGSTVPGLTPTLEWNASGGALSYGIQVSTSSTFTSSVLTATGVTDLFRNIAEATLNWNTSYYWRVNATNAYGSTSSWSSSRYFKTAIGPPPIAPSNLMATPISSSQINLTWQDISNDETGFKIERKTGSGTYSQIAAVGVNITSYSSTRLSANTTYFYRVRAYKSTLSSNYCQEVAATTLPPPPAAPALKSPSTGSTAPGLTPRLEWNASGGAVSYEIQVSASSRFTSLLLDVTSIINLFCEIPETTLNWNTTYYWRVKAVNAYGSASSWSSYRYFRTAVGPPPQPPSNLTANPISPSQITLTWQDNSTDETGFKIERKTGAGLYSQIATVGANVTSYSSTRLAASTEYCYRVRAYKGTTNSDYCSEVAATTLPPPPSAPALQSPSSGSTMSALTLSLEWNASNGAVSYALQVSTSYIFSNPVVDQTGIECVKYDIPEGILNWGTVYYWRVSATNSYDSQSSWSTYHYFRTAVAPAP